jgi:hypothetical protein
LTSFGLAQEQTKEPLPADPPPLRLRPTDYCSSPQKRISAQY